MRNQPSGPTVVVTSDEVVDRVKGRCIRRLAGPLMSAQGRYLDTLEWWLVDGVAGKFMTLDEARAAAGAS